jgi:hypothetical protein
MTEITQSKFIDLADLNLESDCAYTIEIDNNGLAILTKTVDNSKQNFFLYSHARPRMFLISLKPDTKLHGDAQRSIEAYQKETGLIIHGVF